jgi:hypothetical protein
MKDKPLFVQGIDLASGLWDREAASLRFHRPVQATSNPVPQWAGLLLVGAVKDLDQTANPAGR